MISHSRMNYGSARESGFRCPNADGSESPSYTEHNDTKGRDARLIAQAKAACRARYLTILAEFDAGAPITLTMTKVELRERLRQASVMHDPPIDWETGARVAA